MDTGFLGAEPTLWFTGASAGPLLCPVPPAASPCSLWQSLTAALAVRRFNDLTFQEEYSTLFPASAQP